MFPKIAFKKTQRTLVFLMLTTLLQFIPGLASAKQAAVYPRQISLSGNIFHFSMPEDFSKDMPAADMVEQLDINDSKKFDNPEYGNLIRRWWDIKSPGWFGKEMGTVMMDISVQRVPENKQKLLHANAYNVESQFDFMLVLDEQYHQRFDELNRTAEPEASREKAYYSSIASVLGKKIRSSKRSFNFNSQRWISNEVLGPRNDLIYTLATPLSSEVMLEASFTYTANDNIPLREFRDAAFAKMAIIQESFKIDYKEGNPFAKIVGDNWMQQTSEEVLEQHRPQVLQLFSAPNGDKKLPHQEKNN